MSLPLIFVAHSFGGIVVLKVMFPDAIANHCLQSQALLMAEDPDNEWFNQEQSLNLFQFTEAVLFFGTPFRGTHEWFQKDLPKLAKDKVPHVDEGIFETFRKGSEILRQLRTDFISKQNRYKKPNVGCFLESQVSNVGKIVGNENISKVGLYDVSLRRYSRLTCVDNAG